MRDLHTATGCLIADGFGDCAVILRLVITDTAVVPRQDATDFYLVTIDDRPAGSDAFVVLLGLDTAGL